MYFVLVIYFHPIFYANRKFRILVHYYNYLFSYVYFRPIFYANRNFRILVHYYHCENRHCSVFP